jgi:hypothetical protein
MLLGLLATISPASAAADDDVDAHSGEGGFGISAEHQNNASEDAESSSVGSLGEFHVESACDVICTGALTCPDGSFMNHSWIELPNGDKVSDSLWCPSDGGAPAVTDDVIALAFQRIPLPPSTFSIQPPGGRTLVNFDTNFYTEERSLDRTVRLLGQRVDLRIEAHSYTWHFDDGESIRTTKPGAPYPELQVTHNYLQTGGYRPALDITWVADYRVNGGAWQPVPGSVTIEGGPTNLRAIEARPTLVGYEG